MALQNHLPLFGLSIVGLAILYFIVKPVIEYFYDAKHLRRYPNQNFLSGFTNLAMTYERLAPYRTANLYEAHKKHPIIRTGPSSLSFRDVKAIKDIYGHSTATIKGDIYTAMQGTHSNLVTVVDKAHHAKKRKLLSNAFATRNLLTWEYKVVDKVERLMQQFDKMAEGSTRTNESGWGTVDFSWWSNLFTVEAITDTALSHKLGLLESGNDLVNIKLSDGTPAQAPFIKGLHAKNRPTSYFVWTTTWSPTIRRVVGCFSSWFREQYRDGQHFTDIISYLTTDRMERQKGEEKLDDLFHCLMEDRKGSQVELDRGEIQSEVSLMLDAGSDTTAAALTHIMYNLLRNPEKFAKLRDEIDVSLAEDETIPSFSKVRCLPYLKACIDENLRVSPSIPHGLPRKTPPEGMAVMDIWVAGSVTVSVPAYVAHRDPEIFHEPEEFRPERWLDEKAKDFQACYIPFSTGARGCIGRNIAYLEQHVLLAALIKRYDFHLVDEDFELEREDGLLVWTGSLPVKLRRRG
ncbi:cytochrome P450 [Annulohypoxylon moriforme]|nr:cytochrome P450 [Annulohypoxylon moriforme]